MSLGRRVGATTVLIAAAVLPTSGCGSSRPPRARARPAPPPVATQPATFTLPPLSSPHRLAVGLTEANANLLFTSGSHPAPAGFGAARAALGALAPTYLRIVVDWSTLQPAPSAPAHLDGPRDGCDRGRPPCRAFSGLRDELAAVASQQRAGAHLTPVVVFYGVPAWAARSPSGCERPGTAPRSRALRPEALDAYSRLVGSVLTLAASQGVALPYLSPWNEPNHPFFISPQRASCRAGSPSLSPSIYSELVRAMARELRLTGGDHHLVLGELAGYDQPRTHSSSVEELVAALPDDVVCSATVWAIHDYVRRSAVTRADPVAVLERALARRRPCLPGSAALEGGGGSAAPLWVTETGAGAPHAGDRRSHSRADARAGCRAQAAELDALAGDPRVGAVFQYTFREDPAFPVGLIDAGLTHLYPAYSLWRAWSVATANRSSPPPLPAVCAR